jgi:hypothetical protein
MASILEYLDKAGVQTLSKALLTKVNARITERMVTDVDASSDNNHMPTAKAVYTAIQNGIAGVTHLTFQTVIGKIDTVDDPQGDVMYLQKDDEADQTWVLYIYRNDAWVAIGDTSIDLVNYWSKSDSDLSTLKEDLGVNSLGTKVDDLKDAFDAHVDSITTLSEDDINSAVNAAFTDTTVDLTTA